MTRRNRTSLAGAVLALGVVLLAITGCGGQHKRPDVAAMEKGAGVDFCDRYPQPVAKPGTQFVRQALNVWRKRRAHHALLPNSCITISPTR